jgi:hypothetical protein
MPDAIKRAAKVATIRPQQNPGGEPMRVLVLFGLAALTACATASDPMPGPNGRTAYFIKCGSAVMQKCYEQAAKVCPQGYAIVDNQGNPNVTVVPVGYSFAAIRGPNQLFVECKA